MKAEITGYSDKVQELNENNSTWRYFKIKLVVFVVCVSGVFIENLVEIAGAEKTES